MKISKYVFSFICLSILVVLMGSGIGGGIIDGLTTQAVESACRDATDHIPGSVGDRYYVSTTGSDSYSGNRKFPFRTIGKAFLAVLNGDFITIKAGTYTETGLDCTADAIEMCFEVGAIIDPATGTSLTISGDYVHVECNLNITPAAGVVGLLVTGSNCLIENVHIQGGGVAFRAITGVGNIFSYSGGVDYTLTGFELRSDGNRLNNCLAQGTGVNTTGYLVNTNALDCHFRECDSVDNWKGSWNIVTGSSGCSAIKCISGGNDGRWIDVDDGSDFTDLAYAKIKRKSITLDGSTDYNLFVITGSVKIEYIWGHITQVIGAATTAVSLQLFPTAGAAIQITSLAGSALSAMPVGTIVSKT